MCIYINTEYWPEYSFKNIRDSAIMFILLGEIKKQRDLEYLNLFL